MDNRKRQRGNFFADSCWKPLIRLLPDLCRQRTFDLPSFYTLDRSALIVQYCMIWKSVRRIARSFHTRGSTEVYRGRWESFCLSPFCCCCHRITRVRIGFPFPGNIFWFLLPQSKQQNPGWNWGFGNELWLIKPYPIYSCRPETDVTSFLEVFLKNLKQC